MGTWGNKDKVPCSPTLLATDPYQPDQEMRYQLVTSEEEEPMEDPSEGEEMEAEPEEFDPNKDDETAEDSEPMEA